MFKSPCFFISTASSLTSVTVNLQQPSISHSAPDGQFVVGSQGPVITRGHSFTIICFTESQYPGGSFHLFRGSNITRSESAVSHSASFSFPEADYSHEGNYSCVYEVSVSSRSFSSSASELLLITITASLLPVMGAAVSAVLLLLSVLIIILLLKRRQKQTNKETHSECSFTKGAANTYAGASNDNKNKEVMVLSNYLVTGKQNISLVNGLDVCSGRVEILHSGTFKPVCAHSWDIDAAALVCRELECGRAVIAEGQGLFGVGDKSSWLSTVNCKGDKSSIIECSQLNGNQCDNNAGVICSDAVNMQDVLRNDENEENAEDDYEIVDMDNREDVDSDSDQDYVNVNQDDSDPDYINVETDNSEQDYVNVDITEHRTSALTSAVGELQMPTLSLTSTHAVVSRGENIQFRCTTPKPRCNVNAEFQLFRNGLSVSSQTHVSSVTFNHNIDVSHQGSYSCQYSYQNNIKSPLSNTVIITVVNLQQPNISHSAPDGQFVVGSQGPVITRGHSFTIICSTESQYPGGSFHLFRGSNITRMNLEQPSISHSAPDGQFVVGSQGPVITRGHSFSIICSTESQYSGGSFHLFRGSNITRSAANTYAGASYDKKNEEDDDADYENVQIYAKNMDCDDSEEDYVNADRDDSEEDYISADFTENKSVVEKSNENIYECCCDEY
ncbi:deleted in malignant brain tumors 1 -like protein [Labeo rohita]|uniref:Deleted in malignant brain tumors 1-like protein n=1 Tax=Labeo rohita TaxID=84645 RepID=A0A498NNQ0_LABRO|nr:deleted in malignant brain tumors 1 -like protein [Labeo rohita]